MDIPDALFRKATQLAKQDKITFREVLSWALRDLLRKPRPKKKFVLRDGSVGGNGTAPGLSERDWEKIREHAYEHPRPW